MAISIIFSTRGTSSAKASGNAFWCTLVHTTTARHDAERLKLRSTSDNNLLHNVGIGNAVSLCCQSQTTDSLESAT